MAQNICSSPTSPKSVQPKRILFHTITKNFRYLDGGTEPYFRPFLGGGVFPYISRIHTAYIGFVPPCLVPEMFGDTKSYVHLRYAEDPGAEFLEWGAGD